ncbi:MAG: ribosome small subunit-dependent GTPase A [Clostridiales bacterium]|nr:ribosome small subunit-dependent GTPase A [Clostridiales bacterium]
MSARGRIIKGIGGFYYALGDDGITYTLKAQGKLRRQHQKPLVGDYIAFEPGRGTEEGWILNLLPRKNFLVRPPVANLDILIITLSASFPQADMLLCDRLIIFSKQNNIVPIIVVNKVDENRAFPLTVNDQYSLAKIDVYPVSAKTREGLERLKSALGGKSFAFAGQSGVGKSSLINSLYGETQEVGNISEKISRGKNTTRLCSLIPLKGGGAAFDTPGFSLLDLDLMEPELLSAFFPEFETTLHECRFSPCLHDSEPGCSVKERLREGLIAQARYDRYITLLKELKERWNNRYD